MAQQQAELIENDLISILKVNGKGWDIKLFEDETKAREYCLCARCNGICCDAVELGCDHNDDDDIYLYCNQCLIDLIKNNNNKCPINSHNDPVIISNRTSRRQISKSAVICPYSLKYKLKQNGLFNDDNNGQIVDTMGGHEKEGNIPYQQSDKVQGCEWKGILTELVNKHIIQCTKQNNPSYALNIKIKDLQNENKRLNTIIKDQQIELNEKESIIKQQNISLNDLKKSNITTQNKLNQEITTTNLLRQQKEELKRKVNDQKAIIHALKQDINNYNDEEKKNNDNILTTNKNMKCNLNASYSADFEIINDQTIKPEKMRKSDDVYGPKKAWNNNFVNDAWQQQQLFYSQQQNQYQPQQQQASKWQKVRDPYSNKDYWYHVDTKETTWTMPAELEYGGGGGGAMNPQNMDNTLLNNDEKRSNDDDDDEDNDAEILVADTSSKFWQIGESEGLNYPLRAYAERYFQKEKHGGMFKSMEVVDLLKYAPYNKVKHALKKMDAKLDKQAQQIWKNISSYIGIRKSNGSSSDHVDKLLGFALKASEDIRDEIFCQLCKQTYCNPSVDSLIKSWKLMAICCAIFPPSDEFANYLAVYLFSKTKEAGAVGQYATFALQSFDRTMEVGQRRIQPMDLEIQFIEEKQPISLKVYFLDGSFRILLVTSQTRAQQVIIALAKALRLNHGESFGLFEMEEPRPGWEKQVYAKRELMERQAKIDDLQHMPYDRELEINERIMDVFSSWSRSSKKRQRKIRFVFKCKLHSKTQENSYSRNDWKIAFLSVVWHVIHGMYPLEEEDACHLGALQLQGTYGLREQLFYVPGIVHDVIDRYVPYTMLQYNNAAQCEAKILSKHGLYKDLDKQDAYRKYIEYLRKSNVSVYFGCSFFRCVQVSRLKKTNSNEQIDLMLGISENGVIFVNPTTLAIIKRYKMEEVLTYGFRSNAFLLVAGTLETQQKYQFATMLGKQMNDLLRAYSD